MVSIKSVGVILVILSISTGFGNGAKLPTYSAYEVNIAESRTDPQTSTTTFFPTTTETAAVSYTFPSETTSISTMLTPSTLTTPDSTVTTTSAFVPSSSETTIVTTPPIETTPKPTTLPPSSSTTVESTTPTPYPTTPSTTESTTPKPTTTPTPSPTTPITTESTTPQPTTTPIPSPTTPSTTESTTPKPTTTPTPTTTVPPTTTEEPVPTDQRPCILRDYGFNSYVCVCNATYCDTIPSIEPIPVGEYEVYSSNRIGRRFFKEHGKFEQNQYLDPIPTLIYINADVKYQTINGFGSSITDASGININSLESGARRNLLWSYFSKAGIEYSLAQVPIGSTDFSTHPYTYDDGSADPELKKFKLALEDIDVKIPLIKEAQALQTDLTLLASPWAAPAWMKSNGQIGGSGLLKSAMYQPWVDYLIKFLEAYESYGLGFWGITTGNQPTQGRESTPIPSLGWIPSQQAVWIAKNLGPTLQNSPYNNVTVLGVDDERNQFPGYVDLIAANAGATQYLDGFGTQWKSTDLTPSSVLSETHNKYKTKMILTSAARQVTTGVQLGVWDHAERYISNLIQDINNWSTGWVDSNLALDLQGGPTFVPNHNIEAPIIVNATGAEFYKQPIFYAQGHVSKFVPIGSSRISVTQAFSDWDVAAFRRPDGGVVVVIFNKEVIEQPVQINDARRGQIHFNAAPRSISTVVYW